MYAREAADMDAVLAVISPLGTGDTFCATVPVEDLSDVPGLDVDAGVDVDVPFSATISDTIATFVIEVVQDPQFGSLPTALKDSGWNAAQLTSYEVSVASLGPGSDRLRYRLAKALLEVTGGLLVGADGARIQVASLADPTWGSLW
ncbi:MAG: hypothetical protein ACRDTP_08015 [Mycobacteriales bacterium]